MVAFRSREDMTLQFALQYRAPRRLFNSTEPQFSHLRSRVVNIGGTAYGLKVVNAITIIFRCFGLSDFRVEQIAAGEGTSS